MVSRFTTNPSTKLTHVWSFWAHDVPRDDNSGHFTTHTYLDTQTGQQWLRVFNDTFTYDKVFHDKYEYARFVMAKQMGTDG